MNNKKYEILLVKSKTDLFESFTFFQEMWKEEFNIIIGEEKFLDFCKSDLFFIKEKGIIWCLEVSEISRKNLKNEPSLKWVANEWEKILWRIWVSKKFRWKQIWSILIKYILNYYSEKWLKNLFLPSAINNLSYYERFWFESFWEPRELWNTKVVMMKLILPINNI